LSFAQDHRDWSYNLGIYEVNLRQYTKEGTFEAFLEHLPRLKEMGVGILWFMPIHPIGYKNRLGSLGSYYSVRDYLDVNPEFGSIDEFEELVQAAHDMGMYVLMDWVANHTSWDNALTISHPEWYVKNASGDFIPPPGTNWSDVIELDYSEQGLRDYMISAMKFWVEEIGIDGFRCDAVSFVPSDFWQEAIGQLRTTKRDIFMLAEGDGKPWHDVGFDMTYGWGLYGFESGVLKRVADGTNNALHLNNYAASEITRYPRAAYRMYFTSNHDENSWHGTPTELFGDAAEVFSVLTATFNGMPLIYSGQEAGLDKRLLFFDKDQIIWREHKNAGLFTKILHLKRENKALWNGESGGVLQRIPTTSSTSIFAFLREKADDRVVVILNLSAQAQEVTLNGTSFVGSYNDVFAQESVVLDSAATIVLPAWGYLVYASSTPSTGVSGITLPNAFTLAQNYPNPFNPQTTITYSLAEAGNVSLSVYNLSGQLVATLVDSYQRDGEYSVIWDASGQVSGLYFYKITSGVFNKTRKMVLIR
jgi:glycosidase